MREGWSYKKLGEVATFFRGLTYGKQDESQYSDVCVLRSNNIDLESMCLDLSELKYLQPDFVIPEDKKLKGNSLFICMSNGSKQHVGKVAFIKEDMEYAFGGFMGLIRINDGQCAKFYYYLCRSSLYRYFLDSIGNGIGITNLRFSDLNNFEFPVPPLSTQQQIVEELDLLSGIIEKQKAQLKELDSLAQSLFYDMFGDPVANEKGWRTEALFNVAPQIESTKQVPNINGKYWVLNLDMIKSNTREIIEKRYYNYDEIGSSTIVFDNENVLYSKLRPYLNKVYLPYEAGFGTSELIPLRPISSMLNRIYLAHLLSSSQFVDYIRAKVQGAKMPRVSMADLRSFPTILPPLPLQQQFAERVASIEHQKSLIQQQLKETETLFNSRMDYYFN